MENHTQPNRRSVNREGHSEDVIRYEQQADMQLAVGAMLELLVDANDLYVEDDAMPYFEGVIQDTDISIDTLKHDPRIAELLQQKIDHNIKKEITIWLEAEIEAGGEETPSKLKDQVKSRLTDLGAQKASFARAWDHLTQDLPVYFAKNFVTQLKNRNEADNFVAEIERVFSSDSIWTIIDALKENKKLFAEKFSSDDWESVDSILELRMSEFLEKRQTTNNEVMGCLNESRKKLYDLMKLCWAISYVDGARLLDYTYDIKEDVNDSVKVKTRFVEEIEKLKAKLLQEIGKHRQEGQREFPDYHQRTLNHYQENLNRLQEVMSQFNELMQQHERELEQQIILDDKYKWSDSQRENSIKELTTLANGLDGDSEAVANRLRSFAKDIQLKTRQAA